MSDHKVEMLHNLLIELGCQQCERRFMSHYANAIKLLIFSQVTTKIIKLQLYYI